MARRVNTRFLVILTAVVVGGGAIAFASALVMKKLRQNPERFVTEGRALLEQGKPADAVTVLGRAVQLSQQRDPAIWVLYGTAVEQEAAQDREPRENIERSRNAFRSAVEVDSSYMPALRKLFASYESQLELGVQSDLLNALGDTASKILAIEPDDQPANVAKYRVTVLQWALLGVEPEAGAIDAALAGLEAAAKADPTDAKPLEYISLIRTRRASEVARSNLVDSERITEVDKEITPLVATVEAAYKGQETNAKVSLAAAKAYFAIAQFNLLGAERVKGYDTRAREIISSIQEKVAPTDPAYADVQATWAEVLKRDRDNAGAEKVLRDAIDKVPSARTPRLMLAGLLGEDPARRNDAIAVLSQTVPTPPNATAFDVQATKFFEETALVEATNFRIIAFTATQDEVERGKLKGEIESAFDKMRDSRLVSESGALLAMQGKYEAAQGKFVEAIGTLNKALAIINKSNPRYLDLQFQLGRAYLATKQTGRAKETLTQVAERAPGFVIARAQLAQLYLEDNQLNEASTQIDAVERLAPNATDTVRLRLQLMIKQGKREQALAEYAKLPITNKQERLTKVQAALLLQDQPEALRQLEEAAKALPGDLDIIVNQVQLYAALKQPEKAKAVVEAALADNPNNTVLASLKSRLSASTPEQITDTILEQVEKNPDAFLREMQLAELSRNAGKFDDALKHLNAAQSIKPNEPRLNEALFQVYLLQQKFDEANKLIPELAKGNLDQTGGLTYRYQLVAAQGKWVDAEAVALEMTAKLADFAQSWLSYGRAQQANGKFVEAIDKYQRALERQNNNLEAFRGLIDSYNQIGKPEEAKRYIKMARSAVPNDPTFRELELNHELNFGNPQDVIPARQEALTKDPKRPANWQALAMAYLRSAQVNATRLDAKAAVEGYLTKARDVLKDAMTKFPDERAFVALYADACVSLNDFAGAEKALTGFAARDAWKDKFEPQAMLAELYARMGKPDESEQAYKLALQRSDNSAELRQRYATFLTARGKMDEALALLPENDPDATIRRQRINVLSSTGKFTEAEQAVRASLTLTPDSLEMQALLASVYLDQKRFEDATSQVKTVLDKDPKNQMALYVRGLTKIRQTPPDLEAAITDLQQVNELNPKNIDVRIALADAYRMRNLADQAIRVLNSGLQLAPLSKPLRVRLLDLYVSGNLQPDVDRVIRDASFIAPLQGDPEWLVAEAGAYAARGNFDKGADRVKAALVIAPDNLNLVNTYLSMLQQGRNYKAVITEADKVIAKQDAWWAHQYKALAKNAMNDKKGAAVDLAAALKAADAAKADDAAAAVINTWVSTVGPDDAIAQLKPRLDSGLRWKLQAASIYLNKQDYATARSMVESAMVAFDKATPNEQLMTLRFAGSFYLTVLPADPEKALDAYIKLLDKTPNDLAALNNLAVLLAEGVTPAQPDRALQFSGKAYEQLREVGRFDPLVYDTHGWTLVLAGKINDGIDVLRTVVDRAPFADAHYHLGMAYLKLPTPFVEEAQRQLKLAGDAYDAAAKLQRTDPALKKKIDDAMTEANELFKSKNAAPAAGAN